MLTGAVYEGQGLCLTAEGEDGKTATPTSSESR
jgi:hypothetical protein